MADTYESDSVLGTACFRQGPAITPGIALIQDTCMKKSLDCTDVNLGESYDNNAAGHRANRSAILRPGAESQKGDEMPFELCPQLTENLSGVNVRYNGLNENVRKFQQLKAALKKKEVNLVSLEQKLAHKQQLLKTTAEKWRDLCKEPARYEAKKRELETYVEKLKSRERHLKGMEKRMKDSVIEYRQKCKEAEEQEQEYSRAADEWGRLCEAKEREYEKAIKAIGEKNSLFDKERRQADEREKELAERGRAMDEDEKRLSDLKKEAEKKAEEIRQVRESYAAEEAKVVENFNKIKARHLKTLGKKKELLLKEQELRLEEIKLCQQRKDLEATAGEIDVLDKLVSKTNSELTRRETAISEREQEARLEEKELEKATTTLRQREEEISKREALVSNRTDLDQQLEMKMMGIEMSTQALKKKQEFNSRTLESEKQKLKVKELELRHREQELLLTAKTPVTRKTEFADKENVCANTDLVSALAL